MCTQRWGRAEDLGAKGQGQVYMEITTTKIGRKQVLITEECVCTRMWSCGDLSLLTSELKISRNIDCSHNSYIVLVLKIIAVGILDQLQVFNEYVKPKILSSLLYVTVYTVAKLE